MMTPVTHHLFFCSLSIFPFNDSAAEKDEYAWARIPNKSCSVNQAAKAKALRGVNIRQVDDLQDSRREFWCRCCLGSSFLLWSQILILARYGGKNDLVQSTSFIPIRAGHFLDSTLLPFAHSLP